MSGHYSVIHVVHGMKWQTEGRQAAPPSRIPQTREEEGILCGAFFWKQRKLKREGEIMVFSKCRQSTEYPLRDVGWVKLDAIESVFVSFIALFDWCVAWCGLVNWMPESRVSSPSLLYSIDSSMYALNSSRFRGGWLTEYNDMHSPCFELNCIEKAWTWGFELEEHIHTRTCDHFYGGLDLIWLFHDCWRTTEIRRRRGRQLECLGIDDHDGDESLVGITIWILEKHELLWSQRNGGTGTSNEFKLKKLKSTLLFAIDPTNGNGWQESRMDLWIR